jgi:cation diffusion facilitator CzcD-associated flavoprotein CzcO
VVTDEIDEIVENGVKTKDGKFYEVDAIVCATGFNTSFCPNFHLIGIFQASISLTGKVAMEWTFEMFGQKNPKVTSQSLRQDFQITSVSFSLY